MTPEFDRCWEALNLTDINLKELQEEILFNPKNGKVIQGTGGLRKMRFSLKNKGRRGGIRVLYVDFVMYEKVYLITAYAKNIKDNLSPSETTNIRKAIQLLKKEANGGI